MKIIWLGVFVLAISPALGASFDCAKATAPRDKLICSDATASSDDDDMAELYNAALGRLSEDGRQALIAEQRAWLRFLGQACPLTSTQAKRDRTVALSCLSNLYSDRSRDLEQIGRKVGPFVFTVSAHYLAIVPKKLDKNDADGNAGNGITTREMAYPRIDSPLTPITTRWNAVTAKTGNAGSYCEEGGASDDYETSKISFANAHLIVVEWTSSSSCHGAAHGMGGLKTETLVLSPQPHPLKAVDLFGDGQTWKIRLQGLVAAAVRKAYVDERKSEPHDLNEAAVRDAVSDPTRWIVRGDGLGVTFNSYELGQGYAFAPTATIPWAEIKDLLVPDAPVFE
jgi:uncharacterized protein YecT (DUF1311 family)